jgi:Mn2+/Fe2+ NRAMP family transporter
VVPYNLFLGSGLARGQTLGDFRFGLAVAILIGGLISMGVLVVGAAVTPPFEFSRLSAVLAERLGPWARYLFAGGLFAAGLSSAVTAPLAAAVTARSVLSAGDSAASSRWSDTSWAFRSVWIGVLSVGLLFGVSGIRPIPVIIVAQALNGVLLPVVAVFLLVAVNDKGSMGNKVNGWLSNLLMSVIVMVSLFLGITNISKAAARGLDVDAPGLADVAWIRQAPFPSGAQSRRIRLLRME